MNNRAAKRLLQKKGKSRYKGVYWAKDRKKWCAQIKLNYKGKKCGQFDSEIEAARTYDKKAKELFGEFAYTNF